MSLDAIESSLTRIERYVSGPTSWMQSRFDSVDASLTAILARLPPVINLGDPSDDTLVLYVDDLWSVDDAAQHLGCSIKTVYRLIHDNRLSAYMLAGRWVLDRNDVEAFKGKR